MSQIFQVSAYCPCIKCCGKRNTTIITGIGPQPNHTIAAPRKYPFGTRIVLDGYGTFFVEDRNGSFKDNRIDRFFNTHEEALNWGIKYCNGTVYM